MPRLPRLAIGTVQREVDLAMVSWALLSALERSGLRVQTFRSQACFSPVDGATSITGFFPRHLDSWLMSQSLCRQVFLRGAAASDLSLVEGQFRSAQDADRQAGGAEEAPDRGDLDTLCSWLDLPTIAVIDASRLGDCTLPQRPAHLDGLILDRVTDQTQLFKLQTLFETLWGVPVLGSLDELPALRSAAGRLELGTQPARDLCRALGDHFAETSRLDRIVRLAHGRDFAWRVEPPCRQTQCGSVPPGKASSSTPLRVAVAYDEAFHCYFPDTLEVLELHGAVVSDFSPLRDDRLPAGTDIVYFGCGHPERFAAQLANNDCMTLALRDHLCNGRRLYAEGGGLGYLCQQIVLPDGRTLPMAGLFPAIARYNGKPYRPRATQLTLGQSNWFGPAGTSLRGYLNPCMDIEPTGPMRRYPVENEHRLDLIGHHQAIGSRLHLNFAAQPAVLEHFFQPHAAALDLALARSI